MSQPAGDRTSHEAAVLERLQQSAFRRRFRLSPSEGRYLAAKGEEEVRRHAADFVARRLAPAQPVNDGKQTPMRGHPVFVAQHATASCCRTCLSRWHGIPAGRPLSPKEQARVVAVIARWLAAQPRICVAPDDAQLDLSQIWAAKSAGPTSGAG